MVKTYLNNNNCHWLTLDSSVVDSIVPPMRLRGKQNIRGLPHRAHTTSKKKSTSINQTAEFYRVFTEFFSTLLFFVKEKRFVDPHRRRVNTRGPPQRGDDSIKFYLKKNVVAKYFQRADPSWSDLRARGPVDPSRQGRGGPRDHHNKENEGKMCVKIKQKNRKKRR